MDTTVIEYGASLETLDQYPMDNGNRYELIDGDVHVTTQPHFRHQKIVSELGYALMAWSKQTRAGDVFPAPGVILSERNAVAPDLVWVRQDRLHLFDDDDGKLHGAPDLAVEVLSDGSANEKRDRQDKLRLYDRFGVDEYWIVDRFARQVEVYRRDADQLVLAEVRGVDNDLTSPLLPGFVLPIESLFAS
jgi:Uma2 family endonuclease